MLSTRARPLVFPTLTPHQPHKPLKPLKPIISYSSSSSSKASSTMSETQTETVEHVVLFKVDPTATPSKISNMMTSLASLKTLPQVRHLSVGPILKTHSPFTHVLHSRYSSLHDLSSYSSHPLHLSAVRSSVLPICLDILALDWLSPRPPSPLPPSSALRLSLFKLMDPAPPDATDRLFHALAAFQCRLGLDLSFGENFSPARAQGFGIGSLAVFGGVGELDKLDSEEKVKDMDAVRGLLETVIDVDFVVPDSFSSDPSPSASLL